MSPDPIRDRYAVLGNPVAHSRSPYIHACFAAATGQAIEYGRVLCAMDGFVDTVRRFAAEGSPADCVLAGLHDVLVDARPDLVLSGVNRGNNAGENAMYSGTLGGAMEAALQGLPSIAMSQFMGPGTAVLADPFDAAARHARQAAAVPRPAPA